MMRPRCLQIVSMPLLWRKTDAEGKMAMTNLVFPTKPYNKLTLKGKGKYMVYQIGK